VNTRGLDGPAAWFIFLAVVAIAAFGPLLLLQREAEIDRHAAQQAEDYDARQRAASVAADLEASARRLRELAAQPTPTPFPSAPPGFHRVQAGESLFSVAADYGLDQDLLRSWNVDEFPSLASSPALDPGWALAITGPMPVASTPVPVAAAPPAGPTAGNPAPPAPASQPEPGSGWNEDAYWTAMDYLESVESTYVYAIPNALWDAGAKLFGARCDWVQTPVESAECQKDMVASIGVPIRDATTAHLDFMRRNPPAPCFADAYEADKRAANAYLGAAESLLLTLDVLEPDAYDAAFDAWDAGIDSGKSLSEDLLANMDAYLADCG
jgi:hypothetical protein